MRRWLSLNNKINERGVLGYVSPKYNNRISIILRFPGDDLIVKRNQVSPLLVLTPSIRRVMKPNMVQYLPLKLSVTGDGLTAETGLTIKILLENWHLI